MDFSSTIPQHIIRALSNTFIYSLWQGLILAALAGLVVLLTRRSSCRKRYNFLVALMVSFAVAVICTFFIQYQPLPPDTTATTTLQLPQHVSADLSPLIIPVGTEKTVGELVIGYVNTHAGIIVLIWFLVICARSMQLFTGLYSLQRLRRGSAALGEGWEEKLQLLATDMGIRQQVMMAGSAFAKVPMVIGHLKPVILIPAALLTAMRPEEIEAVLIHELAHIRRRDYLVNLLQHLVEIVFFFNPAVLWLSSLIKTERENCCDDITLEQTADKAAYIRALISCQEFQLQMPKIAIGLSGRKNLLGRVNRMVSDHNHSLSIFEKSLLTVCLITAGITLAAFSGKEKKTERPVIDGPALAALTAPFKEETDLAKSEWNEKFRIYKPEEVGEGTSCDIGNVNDQSGYQTYLLKKENVLYQLNYKDGVIVSLQVNGKLIAPESWSAHKEIANRLAYENDKKGSQEKVDHDGPFNMVKEAFSQGLKHTVQAIDEAGMALGRSARKVNDREDTLLPLQAKAAKLNELTETTTTTTATETSEKKYLTRSDVYQSRADYQPYAEYNASYQDYKEQSPKRDWVTVESLIISLAEEHIVEKTEDVKSFMINPRMMILNGKKVRDEIHKMILDKYVRAEAKMKWTIYYNFDTSTIKTITQSGNNAG